MILLLIRLISGALASNIINATQPIYEITEYRYFHGIQFICLISFLIFKSVYLGSFLQIYDGNSTASVALGDPDPWCSHISPDVISSTSEFLTVVFNSDSYENFPGFRAFYQSVGKWNIINEQKHV